MNKRNKGEIKMDDDILECPKCIDEIRAKLQKRIDKRVSKLLKDKVKKIWFNIELTSGDLKERVWIYVLDIDLEDRIFAGEIDSYIHLINDRYNYGDKVISRFDEIEDILSDRQEISNIGNEKKEENICVKKNTERLPKMILEDIRNNIGDESVPDEKKDMKINRLTNDELFNRWCDWNGLFGFSDKIKRTIFAIYDIEEKKK